VVIYRRQGLDLNQHRRSFDKKLLDEVRRLTHFIGGLQRGSLLQHKLTWEHNERRLNLNELISIASIHSAADDDASEDLQATAIPLHQQKKNNNNNNKRKNPLDD
jgi:hypothetical protein